MKKKIWIFITLIKWALLKWIHTYLVSVYQNFNQSLKYFYWSQHRLVLFQIYYIQGSQKWLKCGLYFYWYVDNVNCKSNKLVIKIMWWNK